MPDPRKATQLTRTRGPALDVDPRYLECAIEAWLAEDLSPTTPAELSVRTSARVEQLLNDRSAMGMSDERISSSQVTKAIALFKALNFAKSSVTGGKNARVQRLTVTPEGRSALSDSPATGGIRVALASRLVAYSPHLTALLSDLEQRGPVMLPILRRRPGAPTRGAAYTRSVLEGLQQVQEVLGRHGTQSAARAEGQRAPSVAKLLADARIAALVQRPGANVKNLDTVVELACALGLAWTDSRPVNDNVAIRTIGSAATRVDEAFTPRTPTWQASRHVFVPALIRAHQTADNGSGFTTIEALRGSLGQALNLAPPVVDALICEAREAGERREVELDMQFEENEDLVYRAGREPLYWRQHAFDFVDVYVPATAEHPASR